MINGKTFLISTAVLATSLWSTASFAQDATAGAGADPAVEASGGLNSDNALNPFTRASDRLLGRALEKLDQLPAEAQADVASLQESLAAIRDAWETTYNPGTDATEEEIEAAREQFKADMAEQIAAVKEQRKQVVTQLRYQARQGVNGGAVSEEAKLKGAQYREIGMQISSAWREARAQLGEDATEEEVEAAKEAFVAANADLVAQQKALAAELRANAGANAAERPVVERGEMPAAVQALKAEMEIARNDLRERRQAAREELRNLSEEEREVRRQELVEEFRTANDEMKERRRQLVDDLRPERDGDRRPGE